jgi:hypothetical protein
MANLPQVIVTLAPNGTLIAELPGPNGARRQVPLGKNPGETLTRILQNQLSNSHGDWPGRCAHPSTGQALGTP